MIEQTIVLVVLGLFNVLIGLVLGQHSVWRYLRKKGDVKIGNWCYTAVKAKEGQYKYWE